MIALLGAARALHFASLMVIFGAGTYLWLLRRAMPTAAAQVALSRCLFPGAAVLALGSAIVSVVVLSIELGDESSAVDTPSVLREILMTTGFGRIFLARLAALIVLCVVACRPAASTRIAAPALAAFLLASAALTSHAAASGSDAAGVLPRASNDAVHLLAGGFWLGGLVALASVARRHRRHPQKLVAALQLFSAWGTCAVAILVVTGFLNAATIALAASSNLSDAYGGMLLTKMTLALGMVVLAAFNRWRVTPALENEPAAAKRRAGDHLGLTVTAEILLGFAVVGVAGFAGVMSPQ